MFGTLLKIFYGIVLFLIWFYWIRYRKKVISWTWKFVWAEKYLWNGGTYLVIIIVCLFLMFLGVLYPFWWLELLFWKTGNIKFQWIWN